MKRLAVFDFDHTLIAGDSLWPFLEYTAGRARCYAALAAALATFGWRYVRGERTESPRSFVKAALLKRLLAGRKREDLASAAARTRAWQTEIPVVMQALRDHQARGDIIVIASGGLDLYLPELLRDIPHDALICTEIGVASGVVTGEMVKGNCVRLRKAERVAEWLALNGPFDESLGYGNYPHDVAMMNLMRHRIIV